jgi:hypothetical protein
VVAQFPFTTLDLTRDFHQQFQRDVPSLGDRMKVMGEVAEWGETAELA